MVSGEAWQSALPNEDRTPFQLQPNRVEQRVVVLDEEQAVSDLVVDTEEVACRNGHPLHREGVVALHIGTALFLFLKFN